MPNLEAVGVVVSDLERAIRFYGRLGLEFPDPPDPEGHGHVEATVAGLRFMLDTESTIRSFAPDWSPPASGYRVALAFRCASPADVDAVYAELLANGGSPHRGPWDAFWQQRYAQLKDPDGNVVDLFADLA